MKPTLFLLAALLPAFTSCTNDLERTDPTDPGTTLPGHGIRFAITLNPQTRVATDAAFNSTWQDGDQIGLYAVTHPAGTTATLDAADNYIHNARLTYNSLTQQWTPDTPLYHDGANQLDFYAYHPYDATATNPLNIAFVPNTDLLMATPATNVPKGQTVALTFAHALAMVQVEVDPTYIDRNAPFAATLRGCKAAGTFDLATGNLSATGEATPVKMLRVEQPADPNYRTHYTYRALVPAQTVAVGTSICLMTQNGQLYNTPPLASPLILTPGNASRYTAQLPQP